MTRSANSPGTSSTTTVQPVHSCGPSDRSALLRSAFVARAPSSSSNDLENEATPSSSSVSATSSRSTPTSASAASVAWARLGVGVDRAGRAVPWSSNASRWCRASCSPCRGRSARRRRACRGRRGSSSTSRPTAAAAPGAGRRRARPSGALEPLEEELVGELGVGDRRLALEREGLGRADARRGGDRPRCRPG